MGRVRVASRLAFDLEISPGSISGDATLCDEHANFAPTMAGSIPLPAQKGIRGLGAPRESALDGWGLQTAP